jgi:hypothetical protein
VSGKTTFFPRNEGGVSVEIADFNQLPLLSEKALFYNRLTCGYRNMHSTFIPTDIPTKKLDANARPWIPLDAEKSLSQDHP